VRPAGEIRVALKRACLDLLTPDRAGTLQEIAARACVSVSAARRTLDNMCRAGELFIVRPRKTEARNKPVAEYAPNVADADLGGSELQRVMTHWVNR
jgi:hypothetical protein